MRIDVKRMRNTCVCIICLFIDMYIERMLEEEREGKRSMNNFGAGGKGWNHKHKTAFIIFFLILHPFLFFILLSILLLTISILLSNFSMRYKSIGGEKRKKIEKNVFYYHYFSLKESYSKCDMRLLLL